MTESVQKTVMERLQETFGCHPKFATKYYDDGKFKERVAIHDIIHLLQIDRKWPVTFTIFDEYTTAIAQAVLLRSVRVSYRNHAAPGFMQQETQCPTLESIKNITLPRVPHFIRRVLSDRRMPVPDNFPPIDDSLIGKYYDIAKKFDELFEEKFGQPFCKITAEELAKQDFDKLKTLYRLAVSRVNLVSSRTAMNSPCVGGG